MPPCITRWLNAVRSRHAERQPSDLPTARRGLLHAIHDCEGLPAEQLKLKIRGARHHRDLWQLRSDAFHLISLQHCQPVAEKRLRDLVPLFKGWISPREMSRNA